MLEAEHPCSCAYFLLTGPYIFLNSKNPKYWSKLSKNIDWLSASSQTEKYFKGFDKKSGPKKIPRRVGICSTQHLCTCHFLLIANILTHLFQLFHQKKKKSLSTLYGWNPVSLLLWKTVLCIVGFFLLWALQVSLFIVYRGNGIALQLAMAASPISLAKLLSSWTQNASAHLISSTQSGRTQIFNKLLWMN